MSNVLLDHPLFKSNCKPMSQPCMHGNQEVLLLTCQLTTIADDFQNQSTDLFTALQANLRLDGASIVRVIYLALTFTNVKVRKHVKTNQLI